MPTRAQVQADRKNKPDAPKEKRSSLTIKPELQARMDAAKARMEKRSEDIKAAKTSTKNIYTGKDTGRPSASAKPTPRDDKASTPAPAKTSAKTSKFGVGDSKTVDHKGRKMANVTKEQLKASGLSLREYMNKWNKTGKRP